MFWNAVQQSLQESLPESEYALWVKPLVCHHFDENRLELSGPDRFFCAWVQDRYLDSIRKAVKSVCNKVPEITMTVNSEQATPVRNERSGQLRLPGVNVGGSRYRALHPAYTFDQFMVGESNLLARSACQALASGKNTYGQCLFMNSTPGLGKSHLAQAVAHHVLQESPSTRLQYLTAQQFSQEMVKEIKNGGMDKFTRKYVNNCDILLVEDVHTLSNKSKTQDELNIILDYLIKTGRRAIFTSAVAPRSLDGIDDDFRSRMTSGLVTQIKAPDYDTRVSIIKHKATTNRLPLNDDLVDLLARHLQDDIRKIESAILAINAKSNLMASPAEEWMVKEVLEEVLGRPAELSGEVIQSFISSQYQISVTDLKSRSRKRIIAFPRQVGMYLTRKFTELSLADIGRLYNRDHSTVLYAIKTVTRDISQKPSVRKQMDLLCNNLKK